MRNLKRALSLTLASVMLLGMMVFGTSAASFTDADQITNATAATVLQELEVMQGSNGKFNPNGTVTRGQMAILICKMLYGSKLNAENFAGTSQFDDVPANAYYTGYVNLASSLGIISGYGNGKFGPGAPVTTAQAALMLTRALGWFQAGELENQNWTSNAIAAVEKATSVKLFGNLKLGNNDPLSRDNVAEMVFNALTKTAPVNYNERWDMYYSDEGSIMDGVKFNYMNSLGYKNFTLVYNTSTDDFGRPSTEWGIGNGRLTSDNIDDHGDIISATIRTSILKAADEADLTYTKAVKLCDVYKDLGKPSLKTTGTNPNTVTYKVDNVTSDDSEDASVAVGTFNSSNEGKVGAKGALTEVYKDKDNDIKIVTINSYLVKASADYNTKNEELSVIPYGVPLSSTKIKNEDVAVSEFKKDDLILVTGVIESDKLVVKTAAPATLVEDVKVSAYNTNDYVNAGKKYEYNANVNYDPDSVLGTKTTAGASDGTDDNYNLQKTSYTLVLDKYDYVIGVKKYSDEVTLDDILFVKEAAQYGFNYQAKVLFMDGREETVVVAATAAAGSDDYKDVKGDNKDKSTYGAITAGEIVENRFYEFNKKSNGEYELKDLAGATTDGSSVGASDRQGKVTGLNSVKMIDGSKVQPVKDLAKTANDSTIFIAKDAVYTGIKNAPDMTAEATATADDAVYYLLDSDSSYILAVYTAKKGVSVSSTSEYVYLLEAKGQGKDENDKTYNVYTAIVDGEKVTDYKAKAKGDVTVEALYEIDSTEDGYPELKGGNKLANVNDDTKYVNVDGVGDGAISYKSGVVSAGTGLKVNSDTQVYVVDVEDKSVNPMDASGVDGIDRGTYNVYAIYVSKSDKTVKTLWLAKTSETPVMEDPSATEVENELKKGPVTVSGNVTGTVTVKDDQVLNVASDATIADVTLENGATMNVAENAKITTSTVKPGATLTKGGVSIGKGGTITSSGDITVKVNDQNGWEISAAEIKIVGHKYIYASDKMTGKLVGDTDVWIAIRPGATLSDKSNFYATADAGSASDPENNVYYDWSTTKNGWVKATNQADRG